MYVPACVSCMNVHACISCIMYACTYIYTHIHIHICIGGWTGQVPQEYWRQNVWCILVHALLWSKAAAGLPSCRAVLRLHWVRQKRCAYVYIHTCVYVWKAYTCVCTYMCVCMKGVRMCTYIHVCVYVLPRCTWTTLSAARKVCICVCTYMCVYVCVCMYCRAVLALYWLW